MVSVTHYQDREGTMRNEISPRRYFCTQCHVVQTDAKVPVKNDFRDFYSVSGKAGKGPGR
jgi:cytochrome c-type protein NapB